MLAPAGQVSSQYQQWFCAPWCPGECNMIGGTAAGLTQVVLFHHILPGKVALQYRWSAILPPTRANDGDLPSGRASWHSYGRGP